MNVVGYYINNINNILEIMTKNVKNDKQYTLFMSVLDNDISKFKETLEYCKENDIVIDINHYYLELKHTLLTCAVKYGRLEIIQELLKNDVDIYKLVNFKTAIDYAIEDNKKDIIMLFIPELFKDNILSELFKDNLLSEGFIAKILYWACEKGHSDIVKELIYRDVYLNYNYEHKSPLEIALIHYHNDIAMDLIKAGALYKEKEFLIVIKNNLKYMFHEMLNNENIKLDFNFKDNNGKTALMYTIENCSIENVLDLFISSNVHRRPLDIDIQDSSGYTALMYAVDLEKEDIVSELLFRNANVNIKDCYGYTALMMLIDYKQSTETNKEIFKLLLEKSCLNFINNSGYTALTLSVIRDNVDYVKLILEKDRKNGFNSINIKNKKGYSALNYALFLRGPNYKKIVKEIINADDKIYFKKLYYKYLMIRY